MPKETTEQKAVRYKKIIDDLMPYLEKDFPNLGNRTPASLVDDAGGFNELKKDCERIVKTLNGVIDSKLKPDETHIKGGKRYGMKLVTTSRRALDQTKVKEYLESKGILEEFMVESEVVQHRFESY